MMLSAALMDVPMCARGQAQDPPPHLLIQGHKFKSNHNLSVSKSSNSLAVLLYRKPKPNNPSQPSKTPGPSSKDNRLKLTPGHSSSKPHSPDLWLNSQHRIIFSSPSLPPDQASRQPANLLFGVRVP